jgi:serine/threonine-protein kinase
MKQLGVGGQGQVFLALNTKLDRFVVIKVLPKDLTLNEVNLKRFQREARLASTLDHPNICAIYDLAYDDGLHFIIMQHVEGTNIRDLVNGRPLELASALSIGTQVCDALAAAHAQGIIHRDIKANNVMVTPSGQVKVLDFGLAKLLNDDTASAREIHQTQLTEIGVPYGTATYAAPEQAQGLRADQRADIFSTGVLLYEMLTGKWPFQGKTVIDVRYAVLHDTPGPVSDARSKPTPPKLQAIIDRAMAKEPETRYQSAAEMRDDLSDVLHEISLAQDPNFREKHVPVPPRRVSRNHTTFQSVQRIASATGLSNRTLWGLSAVLLILLMLPFVFWFGSRYRASRTALGEGLVLRLHGSNTIGAKLAPALVEQFLKSQGAAGVRTAATANPEEATVLGTLPGNSSPTMIEIRSHGSVTAFDDLFKGEADIGLSSRKI